MHHVQNIRNPTVTTHKEKIMNHKYKIIDGPESIQGSPEWLEFRKGKISASLSPIIMGDSPFCTPLQLYEQIIFDLPVEKNAAMERGIKLEPAAREWLNNNTGSLYEPVVVQSISHAQFIASLDGYFVDEDGDVKICEIKCAGPVDHATALSGEVPKKYYSQLQHQMDIVDVDSMIYFSFDGEKGVSILVMRDKEYCKNLFQIEMTFLEKLRDFLPPDAVDKDWLKVTDSEIDNVVEQYRELIKQEKEIAQEKETLKKYILQHVSHPRVNIKDCWIQKVRRKGNIDYDEILKDYGVDDAEEYRKPSIESWRIDFK